MSNIIFNYFFTHKTRNVVAMFRSFLQKILLHCCIVNITAEAFVKSLKNVEELKEKLR